MNDVLTSDYFKDMTRDILMKVLSSAEKNAYIMLQLKRFCEGFIHIQMSSISGYLTGDCGFQRTETSYETEDSVRETKLLSHHSLYQIFEVIN